MLYTGSGYLGDRHCVFDIVGVHYGLLANWETFFYFAIKFILLLYLVGLIIIGTRVVKKTAFVTGRIIDGSNFM